jgi:nucleoside phosphorylase
MRGAPVVLIAAMRAELWPVQRALRRPATSRRGGQTFLTGELEGRPALLTWTGVGARAADAGARGALERLVELGWTDARLFAVGVAGGLSPSAKLGEVFAFHTCRRFDAGDHETGRLELAVPSAGVPRAELLTLDRVVAEPAAKAKLWRRLGEPATAAVDMETYYVAARLAASGREVLAVRAISDGPADGLPAWLAGCAGPGGGLSQTRVAMGVLARPRSAPALLELRRRVALASERLCATLRELIEGGR